LIVPAAWLSTLPLSLSPGWSLSTDIDGDVAYTRARMGDASVVLTEADGSTTEWKAGANGSYTPPAGETGTLAKTDSGSLVLQASDGRSYTFNADGTIQEVRSAADDRTP